MHIVSLSATDGCKSCRIIPLCRSDGSGSAYRRCAFRCAARAGCDPTPHPRGPAHGCGLGTENTPGTEIVLFEPAYDTSRRGYQDRRILRIALAHRHVEPVNKIFMSAYGVRVRSLLHLCGASAALALAASPLAHAAEVPTIPGPAQQSPGEAITYAKGHPHSAPPGTNDFTCRPNTTHPRPVVLVHGTDGSAYTNWAGLSPKLAAAGYCVFALNYGQKPGTEQYGIESITASAAELADFVDQVRAATGSGHVDLVGHSQGATVARYYVNRLGGASAVDQWIGVASPSYGGNLFGLTTAAGAVPGGTDTLETLTGPALAEQIEGSPFLAALNGDGQDTVPGVRYTTIGSRYDEVVQPATNIALHGPDAVNIIVDDLCPTDRTGHFNLPYDPYSQQLILNILDPDHPITPACTDVQIGTGIAAVIIASNT